MLEGEFGGLALAVREEGETEFHPVSGEVRGELGGALKQTHGFGGGGVGQTSVNEAHDQSSGGTEGRDFVVPPTEDVVRVVVGGVEGEGLLGGGFHQPGVFNLRAGVGEGGQFAVTNGEGEDVDGVLGFERHGAFREGERFGAETFLLGPVFCVETEIGVLAGNFLEQKGIVGSCGDGLEKKFEGGLRIKTCLGSEGGLEEGIGRGYSRGGAKRSKARERGGEEEGREAARVVHGERFDCRHGMDAGWRPVMEKTFALPAGTPNGLIHESRRRNRITGDQSQVVAEESAGVVELRRTLTTQTEKKSAVVEEDGDAAWERIIADSKPQPKLDVMAAKILAEMKSGKHFPPMRVEDL